MEDSGRLSRGLGNKKEQRKRKSDVDYFRSNPMNWVRWLPALSWSPVKV